MKHAAVRKIISLLMALALLASCCACGGKTGTGGQEETAPQKQAQPAEPKQGETVGETPGETTPAALAAPAVPAEPEKDDHALYEAFLQGAALLYNDKFDKICRYRNESMTETICKDGVDLAGLVCRLREMVDVRPLSLTEVNCLYLDCGSDNIPELALEVVFTDESTSILTEEVIIKEIDGRLQLCYMSESYYRYYEHLLNRGGIIAFGGSTGAASYANGYGYVDSEGQFHDIYFENGDYYLGSWYPESSKLQEVAAKYADSISDTALLRSIQFYGKDGVAEEPLYGAEPEDDALVLKIFEEAQTPLTTAETIDQQLVSHLVACGVEAEEEILEWTAVDLTACGLADVAQYGFNPVFVSTVEELVAAIDDDVTIVLEPGTYNLTQWMTIHFTTVELYTEQTKDSLKGVCNSGYGETEFAISHISGLKLVSRDKENPAQLVSEPAYCHVLHFIDCRNSLLENLVIGHTTEPGTCCGDVVAFTDSYGSHINGCDLYGSGAYGIYASNSGAIYCRDSLIHDCTYGLMEAFNHSYISYDNCRFRDCEGYYMIELRQSDAYFQNCSFKNLKPYMLYLDTMSRATFSACGFDAACAESINTYAGYGTVNVY